MGAIAVLLQSIVLVIGSKPKKDICFDYRSNRLSPLILLLLLLCDREEEREIKVFIFRYFLLKCYITHHFIKTVKWICYKLKNIFLSKVKICYALSITPYFFYTFIIYLKVNCSFKNLQTMKTKRQKGLKI